MCSVVEGAFAQVRVRVHTQTQQHREHYQAGVLLDSLSEDGPRPLERPVYKLSSCVGQGDAVPQTQEGRPRGASASPPCGGVGGACRALTGNSWL